MFNIYLEEECLEIEIDEMYDTYEREYGSYFTDEIDLMYCHSQYEIMLAGGIEPEEALQAVKVLMIGAADEAQHRMDHGYEDEDGENY
jgi:hypothetical protein